MTRCVAVIAIAILIAGCQAREDAPAPVPAMDTSAAHHGGAQRPTADSTAVRDVLSRYYAAIEARDFRAAYALWSRNGEASGQSYDEFADGFAATAHTRIEFTGSVTFEGAAGSIFATVPVRVRATTTTGEDQQFTGVYELRRVNDVPGATPEQLRWSIHGATLDAVR